MKNELIQQTAVNIIKAHGNRVDNEVAKIVAKAIRRLHKKLIFSKDVWNWVVTDPRFKPLI